MGWGRLSIAAALFPPGAGTEENGLPQRLVAEGPYRYVRNPLADADIGVIVGTALLTAKWDLVVLLVAYLMQLALQLPLEERELRERFGDAYRGYCNLVPRFIPRFKAIRSGRGLPVRNKEGES
jgi:protein-S-isoprenylcysteine O-methyltransferase Ste14